MQWAYSILSSVAVQLYHICPHYLINCMIKKKLLNVSCVIWYSVPHLSEPFLILKRNERGLIKNVYFFFTWNTHFCEILNTFVFYIQIFEKYWNITFLENTSSRSRVFPCGQTDTRTDGHAWRLSLFSIMRSLRKIDDKEVICSDDIYWTISFICFECGGWRGHLATLGLTRLRNFEGNKCQCNAMVKGKR